MIKVSIIIPVYNAEKYIERCIDSVINQTYDHIECILVDDDTPDHSILLAIDKIASYQGSTRFKTVYSDENRGASAARNLGMQHATGSYLYFLDSDDRIYPDCIASLVQFADRYPDVDMVLGDMDCEDPVMDRIFAHKGKNFPSYSDDPVWIHTNFLVDVSVSPWNKLLRSEFIRGNELYFKEGIVNEDVLWHFFVSKSVRSFAFCEKKTYYYNYNAASVTTSPANEERRISSWMTVLDTYSENIDPSVKGIENFSLLKLFHHVRLYEVSGHYKISFEEDVKRRIRSMVADRMLPWEFKPMYRLLLGSPDFVKSVHGLWTKGLGILYRLAKWQDKKKLRQMYTKNLMG